MSKLGDAKTRINDMAIEAVSSLITADGKTYFPYTQERMPYFMQQTERWRNEYTSEDYEVRIYTIQLYLVLAHVDENYEGVNLRQSDDLIELILDFFAENPMLTSTNYTTPMQYIFYNSGVNPGIEITSGTGARIIQNAGVNTKQIVLQFTIELPILADID